MTLENNDTLDKLMKPWKIMRPNKLMTLENNDPTN